MAFDAGDIFQTYLQGASFVSNSLDKAEARRRQAEEDELQSVAGKGLEIFAPKYDKDGKLIPRTSGDIFNDPQTLELANHPYMKAARMQGITDPRVKDVRYVGGTPLEDGQRVVPIVEQLDEDGEVISRGPLTEGRSRDGKAAVTPVTVDTMFNHLAGEVYRRNPTLGRELLTQARAQALSGLQTQYRNAASDSEREDLLRVSSSYGYAPEDLITRSGAEVRQQDLASGYVKVIGADNSVRYEKSPEVRSLANDADQQNFQRKLDQQKITQNQTAEVNEANAARFAPAQTQRKINEYNAIAPAKVSADRGIAAEDAQMYERGKSLLLSSDPREQALGREMIQGVAGNDPVKTDALIQGIQSEKTLRSALSSGFEGMTSEQVGRMTAENFDKMPKAEQEATLKGLMVAAENGNKNAMTALKTAMFPSGLGGKGETPKPAKFNETGVVSWTKELPEEDQRRVRLQGAQVFTDANKVIGAAEGSQEEKDLNIAVGDALKDGKPAHVLPLYTRVQLQKDPAYSAGVGTPREFLDEVHMPVVEKSKEYGLNMSPKVLSDVERMAVGLRARGVSSDTAVVKALELEKNPEQADKIARLLPAGASPAERQKAFLDILAKDIQATRDERIRSTLREGADYTFGGGWR